MNYRESQIAECNFKLKAHNGPAGCRCLAAIAGWLLVNNQPSAQYYSYTTHYELFDKLAKIAIAGAPGSTGVTFRNGACAMAVRQAKSQVPFYKKPTCPCEAGLFASVLSGPQRTLPPFHFSIRKSGEALYVFNKTRTCPPPCGIRKQPKALLQTPGATWDAAEASQVGIFVLLSTLSIPSGMGEARRLRYATQRG